MSEKDNIKKLIEGKGFQFRDFKINLETRAAEGEGEKEKHSIQGMPVVYDQETVLCKYKGWDGENIEIRESIASGALDNADMSDVIFNVNHCGRVYARHNDRCNDLELNLKENGLEMRTELWDDDEGHQQLYRDIKRSHLDKMSFAFTVKKHERFEEIDEENNTKIIRLKITQIDKLYDVSVVDIPAYEATEISARRFMETASEHEEAASRNAVSVARAKYKFYLENENLGGKND